MMKNEQKIPEGWSVKKVSDWGEIVSGGTPSTNKSDYWNGNILWLTPSEVSALSTRFINQTQRKITKKGLDNSSAKLLPVNSLIICTRATIGDCCINIVPMSTNQGFKSIIVQNNSVDFLYYLISKYKRELVRKACGSTFLEISKKDIDNLKFACPPLGEQEKIAEILGTWDDGIEKLGKLIEAKKLQKKSLMQKLLTGKHRLKGFTEPWKEIKLGNLGTTYAGLSGKNKEDFGKGSFYISYLNIYQNSKVDLKRLDLVDVQKWETQNTVKYGDVFFTTSSETPDEVGFSSVLLSEVSENIYLNSFCFGYRLYNFDNLIPDFAAYLFRSLSVRKIMFKLAQGATRFNLSKNELMKQKILIPLNTAEQKAIADILSVTDDEINLLNKKLETLKEQKKGLMQKLLTGQIRVKVN